MYDKITLQENAIKPLKIMSGSAGYDLYSYDDIMIRPRSIQCVSVGVSMEIEPGYFGPIFPRSGMAVNSKVTTDAGIFDADYRGIVHVCLKNSSDDSFIVKRGDRIAQIVFLKSENVDLIEVETLNSTERGYKGFGSTGK